MRYAAHSLNAPRLASLEAGAPREFGAGRISEPVTAIFEAYGGAIDRVAPTSTAFPHRDSTQYCLQYFSQCEEGHPSQAAWGAACRGES